MVPFDREHSDLQRSHQGSQGDIAAAESGQPSAALSQTASEFGVRMSHDARVIDAESCPTAEGSDFAKYSTDRGG